MYDEQRISPVMDGSSQTLTRCSDGEHSLTEHSTGFEKLGEDEVGSVSEIREEAEPEKTMDSSVPVVATNDGKALAIAKERASLTLKDVFGTFKPSTSTKEHVLPELIDETEASLEFATLMEHIMREPDDGSEGSDLFEEPDDIPEESFSLFASAVSRMDFLTLADSCVFYPDSITGSNKVPRFALTKEQLRKELPWVPKVQIRLNDLNKIGILGSGAFGQVWLVQGTDGLTGKTSPYALKVQAKYWLFEECQIDAVIREKRILTEMNHPFIVNMVATYQDPTFIYFLLEYIQGGELFSRIHKGKGSGMEEHEAKFYALGIADALGYMHSLKIAYRDMKPENVLIDSRGYPKLVDFGCAKYCPDVTYTFCGTPAYVAPEIITKVGHDWRADNWSFGVLLYEMLSGENPFNFEGLNQSLLFQSIVEDDFSPLTNVSEDAGQLVSGLLVKDPPSRLGASHQNNFLIGHHWFSDFELNAMRRCMVKPPWIPQCTNPFDTTNFGDLSGIGDKLKQLFVPLNNEAQKQFEDEF